MGIEGVEDMHGHSDPGDEEVIEELKREEEGIEPSPPVAAPDTSPPEEAPAEEPVENPVAAPEEPVVDEGGNNE